VQVCERNLGKGFRHIGSYFHIIYSEQTWTFRQILQVQRMSIYQWSLCFSLLSEAQKVLAGHLQVR